MKYQKIVATVLCGGLISAYLAGCAMPVPTTSAPAEAAPAEEAAAAEAAVAEEPASEITEEAAEPAEMVDIKVAFPGIPALDPDRVQAVEEAMNAITETSIGVHADLVTFNAGDYATQIGLMLAGNEDVDVMLSLGGTTSFNALTANKQVMDMAPYLETYAPDAYALMKDYLGPVTIDGKVYALLPYRNYATSYYLMMREDVLDDLGLREAADKAESFEDLTEIFEAVKENTNLSIWGDTKTATAGVGVIKFADGPFSEIRAFDNLSDQLKLIYTDDEGHVSLLPESEMREEFEFVREWNDKGWIYKDSLTSDVMGDTLMRDGVIFAEIFKAELGAEASKEQTTGQNLYLKELTMCPVYSWNMSMGGLVLPVTCDEPEAAMKWINSLYVGPELINLLTYGIEGEDYQLGETGEANYLDGQSSSTTGYHNGDFMFGNHFEIYPWAGLGGDFRSVELEYWNKAPFSPYFGFAMDTSELTNVIAALTAVTDEYGPRVYCGMFTDEEYESYISKLKVAGADEYVQAYQDQLSAWMDKQ